MAQSKKDETAPQAGAEVTQTAEDSPGGVEGQQVKPTADRSDKELKADLTAADPDREVKLGALKEPEHEADQSPYPVQDQPPLERPPFATARPDVPIVESMIKGAGAHTPPPPEDFHPDGRPRLQKDA